ncbi:MAG: D-alanyl-D-alanine carboxypeptidase [Desulfovibrio sp.]|nr:D-alanyl-D-alanine carboxypeptidase [Desulfovibrio sp.]
MIRMFKALISVMVFFASSAVFSAPAIPPASLVGVCSAIVFDLDNDVILFEQNPDQRIPPASLTKVMSMFLAMDYIRDGLVKEDDGVVVSRAAASAGGSVMGLRAGETVPLKKLLLGMAVSSGNDASYAVAETVGGSAENFVKMMNARANELGMENSHFKNPHGLPAEDQYTTARDMLTLARAYLRAYPDSLEMHNTKIMEHAGYRTWNKNPLLDQYPGADGLKSGWIRASGYNLIFTATKNGRRLLAVILGAPDTFARSAEACRLLDAGFLVCDNQAVSLAQALDSIPYDEKRIDPLKTGREAGLLKKRNRRPIPTFASSPSLLPAPKSVGRKAALAKSAARKKAKIAAKKASARKSASKATPKRKQHAQRSTGAKRG